uniref:PDDEXK nuclease domain-containing protein n=1 Tax=Bacteroides caecimuris TaxID=1796613 RepID=UPI0027E1EEF0|nr:PDDEXK nuclease domain-containing protein [Bacteroides caecimuris]
MNFEALVKHISTIQNTLQAQAAHAVNLALTSRNWLMGCYIVEQLKEPITQYIASQIQVRQPLTAESEKCHVIVELKIDKFQHEYASQLNMHLNYFKAEVMQPDDNPPIGILLCTEKGGRCFDKVRNLFFLFKRTTHEAILYFNCN